MSLIVLQNKLNLSSDGKFGSITFKAANKHFNLSGYRAVHFWAQIAHETGDFSKFEESLYYSPEGLRKTFGKYFPGNMSEEYGRKSEKIANRVYANRMGNGDENSGDGWKYRGRGAIQLTGKYNYIEFSKHIGVPGIIVDPDLVTKVYPFESAIFFFDKNNLWDICDNGISMKNIESLTKRINGGINGLAHRISLTEKYSKWI